MKRVQLAWWHRLIIVGSGAYMIWAVLPMLREVRRTWTEHGAEPWSAPENLIAFYFGAVGLTLLGFSALAIIIGVRGSSRADAWQVVTRPSSLLHVLRLHLRIGLGVGAFAGLYIAFALHQDIGFDRSDWPVLLLLAGLFIVSGVVVSLSVGIMGFALQRVIARGYSTIPPSAPDA